MQVSIRSYLTAGTALVGAGAIALSPISPVVSAARDAHPPTVVSGIGIELTAVAPNPVQTWVDLFANTYTNLSFWVAQENAQPVPLVRQILANMINYASIDLAAYQAAASAAVQFFEDGGDYQTFMQYGVANFNAGNVNGAIGNLYVAMIQDPIENILIKMESALAIPVDITANLAAATNYLMAPSGPTFIVSLGATFLTNLYRLELPFANDLQSAYSSALTGNWVGTIASLIDIPTAMLGALINGDGTSGGLIGSTGSFTAAFLATLPQKVVPLIVSPGAQNILTGGTLTKGLQNLVTQFQSGWPPLQELASIPGKFIAGFNGLPQAVIGAITRAVQGLIGSVISSGAAAVTPVASSVSTSDQAATTSVSATSDTSSVGAAGDSTDTGSASRTGSARLRTHSTSASSAASRTGSARLRTHSTSASSASGDSTTSTDTSGSKSGSGATAGSAPGHARSSTGAHHSLAGSARHAGSASSDN